MPPYVWITLYEISRCYGGPEEGGWWYDYYTPTRSMRVSSDMAGAIMERWEMSYLSPRQRQRYLETGLFPSVRGNVYGGPDYIAYREDVLHQFATTEVPHYE